MVSSRMNVSVFGGDPPSSEDDKDRFIQGNRPLYDPEEISSIINDTNSSLSLWTRKCKSDVRSLEIDDNEVGALISLACTSGHYIKSEWCTAKDNGPWAACDSYSVRRSSWNSFAHKDLEYEYFVKFAIAKTGNLLLIISCHT